MRLIILSSEFKPGPGGIGTHAYELALNLVKMGWDVKVIASQDYVTDSEVHYFNAQQPFEIIRIPQVGSGILTKAVYRFRLINDQIRKYRPDILIATGLTSVWIIALLNHLYRLPWLAIGHGKEFGINTFLSHLMTRWAYQRATGIVCVSQYTRRRMLAIGIKHSCETVIPNGANSNIFYQLPSDVIAIWLEKHQLIGKQLVLSVGSITNRKGYDLVISSLPSVIKKGFDVHYLIIGMPLRPEDPKWQAYLVKLADDLGVGDRVHLLGYLTDDEVVTGFNACDIFVLTSRHSKDGDFEGYGIVVVEAALCGKPSIVSTNGGLQEAVIDGETGICVPEDNSIAIGSAICSLLSDPARRMTMGIRALEHAQSEQSWAKRVKEYEVFMRSLL